MYDCSYAKANLWSMGYLSLIDRYLSSLLLQTVCCSCYCRLFAAPATADSLLLLHDCFCKIAPEWLLVEPFPVCQLVVQKSAASHYDEPAFNTWYSRLPHFHHSYGLYHWQLLLSLSDGFLDFNKTLTNISESSTQTSRQEEAGLSIFIIETE